MSSFASIAERMSDLPPQDLEWIRRLVSEWQMIADLAYADLVVWLPTTTDSFVAAALRRPGTGATIYHEDVVGTVADPAQSADMRQVMETGVIQRHSDPRWHGPYGVRQEIIPVVNAGRVIAVITRHANTGVLRSPSRLEINYMQLADELLGMVARGEYPSTTAPSGTARNSPRVGDGVLRLNTQGQVTFASPNALSAFHRAGVIEELAGSLLVEVLAERLRGSHQVDETLPVVAMGRAPWLAEIEIGLASIVLRSVPLTHLGSRTGALILVRDVTDLRRSEMELMTKDATIREIHHRVKNNLQEVAALLRMQARRSSNPEVKSALRAAIGRVSTIATVHEALSQNMAQTVDFDAVFGRALRLAADAASTGFPVRTVLEGSFGDVPGDNASALAMVLTELVTNAVEHGLGPVGGGTVWIEATRRADSLTVTVADDGAGMPTGGPAEGAGLGTQIVRTFATGELRGSIDWTSRPGGGTKAVVTASLH
ncbi:MAG: PAS domain-containing sensor histidine kinase [Bifidobacteriaceae bacterium]|nr:PAS domain-containing sensor histidine kinase [Bifidobacteriaceae bacterium]